MAKTIVYLYNHAAIAQEMWIPIGEMNRAAGEASSPKYYPGRSTSPDYFDPSRGACLLAQVYMYIQQELYLLKIIGDATWDRHIL